MEERLRPERTKKRNYKIYWAKGKMDIPFLLLVVLFTAIGLIMIASASYVSAYYNHKGDSFYFVKRQLLWIAIGAVVLFLASRVDIRTLWNYERPFRYLAFALVILVLIPGIGIAEGDARRWLGFGSLTFQPSEIAKIALVIYLAKFITEHFGKMKKFRQEIFPAFLVMMLFTGLVMVETHFSGAILIFGIGIVMMFVGGVSMKFVAVLGGFGATGLLLAISFIDYARQRLMSWLDPFADPLKSGYQAVQSLYAIGSGGLFGLGLGQSRQKHLYIPEAQNDYIFSIICEELGFLGALAIILLYIILIWRGFKIAFHIKNRFGMMLVIGIVSRVALQAILNICVVTNLLPSTGIGLPFISYGGTAYVILMAEMGIVLSASRYSDLDKDKG